MTRLITIFITCFVLHFSVLPGQDTTFLSKKLNLNEITISGSRKSSSSPIYQIKSIDSVSLSEKTVNLNLTELLQQLMPLNLTSYGGKGSLTSIHLRGTGSNHTQMNWNGIPLNSITAGSADLAQFLPGMFDRIEVVSGATGSMFGSGAMGGAINLENRPNWSENPRAMYYSEAGSWNHWLNGLNVRLGNNKFQYHISGIVQKSNNSYPFKNNFKPGNPTEQRVNDTLRTFAIQQNMFLKLPASLFLQAGMWFQSGEKDTPNSMSETTNRFGSQQDLTIRNYVRLKKLFKNAMLVGQTSLSYDQQSYTDRSWDGNEEKVNHSQLITSRWMTTAYYRQYLLPELFTEFGFETDQQSAQSVSYANHVSEFRGSIYSQAQFQWKSWITQGSFRIEFTPYLGPKPLYSIGLSKNTRNGFKLRFLVSNKFRTPTLNERYWNPGGNMDLEPEFGHGVEMGLTYHKVLNQIQLQWESNLFIQNIHNWIQWVPSGPIWSPQNVRFVSCRGADMRIQAERKMGGFNLLISSSVSYTESLDMQREGVEQRTDRQLSYIPFWMANGALSVSRYRWSGGAAYRFAGNRYTTDDHDPWLMLSPTHMIDLHGSYRVIDRKIRMVIKIRIENLLNLNYQWVMGYPSPGRSYYVTLLFDFGHAITHQ